MNRFLLNVAVVVFTAVGCPALKAELWTNAAGKVISAGLEKLKDGQITLRLSKDRVLSLPLTSLSKSDQQRALSLTKQEPVPPEMTTFFAQAEQELDRANLFLREGKISREVYDQRCEQVMTRFERLSRQVAVQHRLAISPSTLNRWKARLRERSVAP